VIDVQQGSAGYTLPIMTKTPLAELKHFESEADEAIAALPLLQLSARPLLAGFHFFLYQARHAKLLGLQPLPGVADSVEGRLSYLLDHLAARPSEPFGASGRDALDAFMAADPEGKQLSALLAYSHFSEFMPEVHKGYYAVERAGNGFRLLHRDPAFAEAQAHDILLSELAIPFPLRSVQQVDPVVYRMAETAPIFDPQLLSPLLDRKTKFYLDGLAEANLITNDGMQRVFGFDYPVFYRIRAAVMAFAEFALELSVALGRIALMRNGGTGVSDETLEWVSVNHEAQHFVRMVAGASGCSPAEVERFVSFFSIDFRARPAAHNGGDGFFPPFARFDDSFVFGPSLVLSFTQLRNAIFAFSREDRATFDNHVSAELEPVLLSQAIELLTRTGGWITRREVRHDTGEIDLLIASEAGGPVLLVQAKGPLPPQGARLTERLAGRIMEGIRQIDRFRQLGSDIQESIVSDALGRRVAHEDLRHGILARSCFGAPEAFDARTGAELLTLPTLSLALDDMRRVKAVPVVDILIAALQAARERLYRASRYRWEEGDLEIAGRSIRMPLLKFDHGSVNEQRRRAWDASIL
jgi:hypothetical protein